MTKVGSTTTLLSGSEGAKERRKHAAYAPPRAELAGPGELQIRPHASAGDGCRAGRQPHAGRGGEVDLAGQWAELPFDAGSQIENPELAPPCVAPT